MDTAELKVTVIAYNNAIEHKKDLSNELKELNTQMKEELEPPLIEYLVTNNKNGFSVDNGEAEICLKETMPSKGPLSKKRLLDNLPAIFTEWKLDNPDQRTQQVIERLQNATTDEPQEVRRSLRKRQVKKAKKSEDDDNNDD